MMTKIKIELLPVCIYIAVGAFLGIFMSLFFALAFGAAGVVALALLCICALIFYFINQSQKTNKKPEEKEQFINWKFMHR